MASRQQFEVDLLACIPRLRRYARALVGSMGEADDLVQGALERAWRKRSLWQGGNDMRAWVFSIMHNLYVDQVRRAGRQIQGVSFDDGRHGRSDRPVEQAQLRAELDAGLARLPDEQRRVLLLVGLEGFTYEEVAMVLGIPLGTVMSRLYRARERMRRWLAQGERPRLRRIK